MNHELLHPDRLFPIEEKSRKIARDLFATVQNLPIISPHGHTDPTWFSEDKLFSNVVDLLITPDHYILRMLYSHGIELESLGLVGKPEDDEKRSIWKLFAKNFYLFHGTPSAFWLKHVFHEIFQIQKELNSETADFFYDEINSRLKTAQYKPRALFERFKIEILATTDSATDSLSEHQKIKKEWGQRILPTYRPDAVIDPEHEDFQKNLKIFGEVSKQDVFSWKSYLQAHRERRQYFKSNGATATDHGHPSAKTLALSSVEAEKLFQKIITQKFTPEEAENFRAHMLWQMASMSLEDHLVMQIHAGSYRNHNPLIMKKFGRDKGADIPISMEYTRNLKPLLDSFGNEKDLKIILFTLDESNYSRELAPLAGHYPCLKLGPAWWFHDSPEGMLRHRTQTVETAGFYNVTGFIDDTRAFFSIPARHDMARRIDARLLAQWVGEHRISFAEAQNLIKSIHSSHAKECFRL